jgi:hypothetical protein
MMNTRFTTHTMRLALTALAAVIVLSAAGCAEIVVTPESRRVATEPASAVRLCEQRGVVFALAPFSSLEQPLDQLKIRAHQIGADTVVLLGPAGARTKDWSAIAYRCGNVLSRNAAESAPAIEAAR